MLVWFNVVRKVVLLFVGLVFLGVVRLIMVVVFSRSVISIFIGLYCFIVCCNCIVFCGRFVVRV